MTTNIDPFLIVAMHKCSIEVFGHKMMDSIIFLFFAGMIRYPIFASKCIRVLPKERIFYLFYDCAPMVALLTF